MMDNYECDCRSITDFEDQSSDNFLIQIRRIDRLYLYELNGKKAKPISSLSVGRTRVERAIQMKLNKPRISRLLFLLK